MRLRLPVAKSPFFSLPSFLDCKSYPVQKYKVICPAFLQRLWLGVRANSSES